MLTTIRPSLPMLLTGMLLFAFAACEKGLPPTTRSAALDDVTPDVHVDQIDWFEGTVEGAFALARAEGRPVYLYWGAVWCPPCQEIKNTVFKSKQFVAQTELFIPVYLDGDTERAQTWGETFGVKGYPTMIVFNPEGEEITRIPGGIDITRYNRVLALSLEHMRPTSMLVDLALNDPEALQSSDYQQLAYYSWGQDDQALPEGSSPDLFLQLADQAGAVDAESSARLYLQGLTLMAELAADDSVAASPRGDAGQLLTILASPELVIACWDYLAYWSEEISGILSVEGDARDALQTRWQDVMLGARHHDALSTAEQLGGWFPYLSFVADENGDVALSDDIIAAIRADGQQASNVTRNAYARQSVVNMISYLYRSANLKDDAKQLLLAELDRSKSPYYFMSTLGYLAEQDAKTAEALEWRRQAYNTSEGNATRFQWGVGYASALVRLKPDDDDRITATALVLLDDLESAGEPFAGRNLRRLKSLNGTLRAWDEEQIVMSGGSTRLQAFDARLKALCGDQEPGSTGASNCAQLLAEVEEGSGA